MTPSIQDSEASRNLPDDPALYERLGTTRERFAALLAPQRAELAGDGVWEIPILLKDIEDAVETLVPLPLPYLNLDSDLVAYVEETVGTLPPKTRLRLVIELPAEKIRPAERELVSAVLSAYFTERMRRRKREERAALKDVGAACLWGFAFMLGCQLVRWIAQFPEHPALTNTISEGLLVLGWVALWNPYDRLLFSWWPAVKRHALVKRIARAGIDLRPARWDLDRLPGRR